MHSDEGIASIDGSSCGMLGSLSIRRAPYAANLPNCMRLSKVRHESLLDAKILYRDVSIGNIMLTMAEDHGFLINLALAVEVDREKASGAPSKTGTKVFMVICAPYGEDHNSMHDLESFFPGVILGL
jgi:hypothetical protein